MNTNLNEIRNRVELNYGIKKIEEWYDKGSESLSIVTIPYNSTLIFSDIILKLVKRNKKILYIWNGKGIKQKLASYVKRINKDIKFSYITSRESREDITFINYRDIDNINEKYDLVIYDDISYYSSLNNEQINKLYRKLVNKFTRFILYSIEELDLDEQFYLGPLSTEKPFVEPRIINTRIDLNNDIPCILYDYLTWFKLEKKKVVFIVPREENIECVYKYYIDKLKLENVKILKVLRNSYEEIKKQVLKICNQSIFIITNDMEVVLKDFTVDEAVILFSDSIYFSYKKFLYICAYIGKVNKLMPEVLLVSKETTIDMDTAKDISRNFNKFIWEKKLK